MDTLFDYVGDAPLVLDARAEDAARARFGQIADYYAARRTALQEDPGHADYRPLPPDRLYLTADEFAARLAAHGVARLAPFEAPPDARDVFDCGGHVGRDFAPERLDENVNVFEAAVRHIRGLAERGRQGRRRRLERRLARAAEPCAGRTRAEEP